MEDLKTYPKLKTNRYNFNKEASEVFGWPTKEVLFARAKDKSRYEPETFNLWIHAKHIEKVSGFYSMESYYDKLVRVIYPDFKSIHESGIKIRVSVVFGMPTKSRGSRGFPVYDVNFEPGYAVRKMKIDDCFYYH